MTTDDLHDDALSTPDPTETSTETNDPGAGFAPDEDEDLAGVTASVLPPTELEKEVLAALEASKINLLSDPVERQQGLSALRMVYEAKAQQRAYWQKAAEAKRRLAQAEKRPILERPPGTVGQPNSAIERMYARKHDKRIQRAQRQMERAQEQAKLWGKTAHDAASQLNTPDIPKSTEKKPRGKPTVGHVSVSEEEALGAPTVRRIEGNKSNIASPADIAAGNLVNDPKKRLAPEKFTGVEHLYAHPETMLTEWTTALQEALGPNRQMQMNRRTFFHHDLVIDGEHHVVTLDPVFNRPVIQGKSVVPITGQTPYQAMAKTLADAPNLPKALEAGVNLPQLSEQTLRHYGGALSRAYVARMKSLRQISPKSLQMVYGQGEVEPIYYFEQDEDLVALPANLRGTDSGDMEDIWGRRGMMAMDAQEVFPETLGYVTLPNGKFVVPNVAKGMARAKIEMNSTEVRFNAMTDIAHHRDPKNTPDIVRRSKLRPQSGQIDREAVIGTLIVPHMPEPQAQMRLNREVADRLILGQNKKGSETISFDDLADLKLPGAYELGQMHQSPWMRLYERAGKSFGVEHPDAQYTTVDAVRVNLPRTSETGHLLMRQSYRLRTADDKPIHLALNEHMFALLDPESATPEEYGLAVQEANKLLAPHSMVIGGGKKRGTTYDPQIEWDYRFWNHPRHTSKVQGSIGQKATSAIHSVMGYSPNPEQEALMQSVGAIFPGDEPIKMATVYMAAMANMAPHSPTLREELKARGLEPDQEGAYRYGEDTWQKWITAVREIVLDPIEGKNPQLAQKLADEKFLHPNFVVQTIADYHTAAPFMEGGNVPGYQVDEIHYQMADEKGNLPEEPTEGYLITSPPMTAMYAPLPYKFLTSIPVSDRPGKMNFSDLNRLYLRDKPLFEAIRQLGEPHQRTAQSIVEAALNVPISDEDVTSGRGRILRSAPPIEEDARILEEKATGVKPERAADLHYAQALKEWATNPTTGVVQDLAIQKGQLRQRLLNPDALLHVGNFGIEGHNDARIFSDQVNTIRNLENQDRSTFLYYEKRFEQSIREMAVQPAIRKALWGGPLEHAYTHNMAGNLALPPNTMASGYTGREQKRYLTEGDETFDQLSAIASRQPSITMNQTLPMQALTLEEANQKYAMGLDLDPRFTPRNLSINPAGSAAALRQADYDGDIQLVALVSSKMGVSPASEEATLRAALISSNLPKEKVDELMAAIPTADKDTVTEREITRQVAKTTYEDYTEEVDEVVPGPDIPGAITKEAQMERFHRLAKLAGISVGTFDPNAPGSQTLTASGKQPPMGVYAPRGDTHLGRWATAAGLDVTQGDTIAMNQEAADAASVNGNVAGVAPDFAERVLFHELGHGMEQAVLKKILQDTGDIEGFAILPGDPDLQDDVRQVREDYWPDHPEHLKNSARIEQAADVLGAYLRNPEEFRQNHPGIAGHLESLMDYGWPELLDEVDPRQTQTPPTQGPSTTVKRTVTKHRPVTTTETVTEKVPVSARRQALIRGWQQTYQQTFAGGDAEAKGQNWIENYVPKAPGGDLLAQSVAKNVNAIAVASNTDLMRPAINEAHAKSMVGSVDSGIEGLIAVTSGLGLTNPEDWEYLHAGLGLNAKQPTIDLGGKKNLDELTRDYNWIRGGHWRHLFNREWRDSMHVDRVIDFVNAARRRGVHMEALEPLLRDASGDINERHEGVYNLLKIHDQAGRDVRLQDLLNAMGGTQNQSYDADQAMGLLENTPLSLYGRAMEMARTGYLVDNEEPVQTGSYPKSNILGLLHQEGIEQVPTWYARMITNRNDPAKLREGGIPVGVDEARKRVGRYVREKTSENPLLNMAYNMLLGRRMASSNQTFQDLETEGPEAYPRLIRSAARYGNDLFAQEAKGRLKPIAYGARPWDRTDDLEVQYDEHKQHLAAKAREMREAYQKGGWGAVKRVETLSNEVFSPSGLRDEGDLQQMIEGFVLSGDEQTAGFHPAAREAMGEGSIWHDLHREMRIAQGANPKNLEQSMLWTGAGVAYYGRMDELDPATKTIHDLKFVSANQYEQATQKGGSYRYNEAQVASYAYGKSEMTGEDWRYGTLTYVNRDQADTAMEQLLTRKGFRPRRPRESYGDYLSAAREGKAITPAMTNAVLQHVQSTEMPPIDRDDPAVQQNLSRMVGAQIMASFVARKTGLTRAKSIGGRRGRPQANPINSAMRKTKAVRQAMTSAGYGKLYQRPVGLPEDPEEEFMSFNDMRREGEEDYNLKQAGGRTRRSLADQLNTDPADMLPADIGVRGPPADDATPDTTLTPTAPTQPFNVQDAQENLAALVDAPEPESYSSQVRRFNNLAALGGIGVREGQDVAGWASTTIDADRPIIKLGKRIDEHPRADAVRFHELGHAAIRLKYGKRENIPDSVPAILGLPDTPETREALDRQLERARVYAYGEYRQDPDKESTPSEKAADIVGLSMMDPDAIGAPSVAPQVLAAANLFVSSVDPILASAAGLNAQIPAANLNNGAANGQPPKPPKPPTAGAAGAADDNGTSGPGQPGRAQSAPQNGAQQPQGVGHPYGAMADWMSGAQTSGAMYTMRARMKDGVYQFSVDKLKEPGKEGVPTIDQLIQQVGKSGEYYAELNPWIQRLEEAMKSGVHDLKGLSTALRRSQAALKDMYGATPKPWEYNLSLSRKGQPGIAEHDRFNADANQRLKQIKEAQHQVSFMQNRLRMTQIQEGVMDLETYGDYFRDKYDKGPRGSRGGGGGGGRRGGMGEQENMSPWGVFTDQMGGFAGLGWLGWGMFGLQRVDNFAFDGIREDIEMYRGGQVGLDTMRRAEYGIPTGSAQTLTQKLTGNDFIRNYVKMQTGEKFQGWSTALDDTWNRLYSVDEQVGIHTKKEMTKGILGAVASALITGNMLSKTGKTMRAAGSALGAMAGFQAIEAGETPQEEMENLVTTAINLAVGGGFVVEKFGKQVAPKAAGAAVAGAAGAAGKYLPKGIGEAIGYYGLGKFGATALGKGAAWLGKGLFTKALPQTAMVAMGFEGALMGMGALASLVPESDRDAALYDQYLEGSPVSRALAPWLADKTPWAAGLQKSVRGLVDWGNQNTLGKLTGQAPREPSAAQERAKAVKAMQSGNLSTLPIKDHEDLMFYLGAAGAGQTPEEVARYAGRFMALTGNTLDDLKDPNNPATKLMYTMVSQAVREGVNVNSMQNLGFSVAGEVGLLPNNPRGQRFADSYLTLPTIQQEQLSLGLGFVGQWNNDRMGLSVGAQTQMGYTFGTRVAPNYTTGQISRAMRLVQPSTPYEYNLSLARGILTPQNIESGWGIPAGNVGATMDLSTGLPANYDAMIANEDYTRGLSRGYTRWQWGFEEGEQARKFGVSQSLMDLSWKGTQMGFRHQREDMARSIGNIGASLGMQLAERALQRDMMMTGFRHTEEEMAVTLERRPIMRAWQDEDIDRGRDRAGLEYGWKQEDYQRAMRFSTGRDKIDIRRRMERDQVRYGMDEDQRGKEEERLEQQRQWEDEDFARKKGHYEELKGKQIELFDLQTSHMIAQANMQIDNIRANLAQLEEQAVLAKDVHDIRQKDLIDDKAAWEAQHAKMKEYTEAMWKAEDDRLKLIRDQEKYTAAMNLLFVKWKDEDMPSLVGLAKDLYDWIESARKALADLPQFPPTAADNTPPTSTPVASAPLPTAPPPSTPSTPLPVQERPPGLVPPGGGLPGARSSMDLIEQVADLLFNSQAARTSLERQYSQDRRR